MADAAAATTTPAAPAATTTETASAEPAKPKTEAERLSKATEIARKSLLGGDTESKTEPEKPAEESEPEKSAEAKDAKDEPSDETEREEPRGKAFKKLRIREQAIKELERKVQDGLGKIASWEAEKTADEKLKAEDPYAWARKHGLNFRDLAKKAVGEETQDPRDKAIAELRAELAELKGESTTRKEREQSDGIAAANAEIRAVAASEFAKTSAEDFPYLHAHDPAQVAEAVRVEMVEHFAKTGEELSPRQVLARLERQMSEYVSGISGKVASRKKPAEPPAEPPAPKPKKREEADVTSRAAAGRVTPKGALTDEERIARATALARDVIRRG